MSRDEANGDFPQAMIFPTVIKRLAAYWGSEGTDGHVRKAIFPPAFDIRLHLLTFG